LSTIPSPARDATVDRLVVDQVFLPGKVLPLWSSGPGWVPATTRGRRCYVRARIRECASKTAQRDKGTLLTARTAGPMSRVPQNITFMPNCMIRGPVTVLIRPKAGEIRFTTGSPRLA